MMMLHRIEKMKRIKFNDIFVKILIILLTSIMLSMLHMGASYNLQDFMAVGCVYDFPESALTKSSSTWIYDPLTEHYTIIDSNALNKYLLNGKQQNWKCLYVVLEDMNVEVMEAEICYYDRNNNRLFEQPVSLHSGENIIFLQEDLKIYYMGLRILNGVENQFRIESMQIRTTVSGYTNLRFVKNFSIFFVIGLFVWGLLTWAGKRISLPFRFAGIGNRVIEILQFIFQLFGNRFGPLVGGRLGRKQADDLRVFCFSGMLIWMFAGNATGWNRDETGYKYYFAVYSIFLLAVALISWERTLRQIHFRPWLAGPWFGLGLYMAVSDFVVSKDVKFAGDVLIFVMGFLVFVWNQMERREQLIRCLFWALEFTFAVGICFCLFFRPRHEQIAYNGLFPNSEQNAMYALLMLAVFLAELVMGERNRGINAGYAAGAGTACYLLAVTEEPFFCVVGIAMLLFSFLYALVRKKTFFGMRGIRKTMAALLMAGIAVCGVHLLLPWLPGQLSLGVEFADEVYLTAASEEELPFVEVRMKDYEGELRERDDLERMTVYRNYIRRWNLFGNNGMESVFRKETPPYNSYIGFAYRYGLFILVPYCLYQICAVRSGVRALKYKKYGQYGYFTVLLAAACILLGLVQNVESLFFLPWGFCFYLLPWLWGVRD